MPKMEFIHIINKLKNTKKPVIYRKQAGNGTARLPEIVYGKILLANSGHYVTQGVTFYGRNGVPARPTAMAVIVPDWRRSHG